MSGSILLRRISLLTGIQPADVLRLRGKEMAILNSIHDAYLWIEDGKIKNFGPDKDCPVERADQILNCAGKIVLPSFCDSHTHLVFAAWRANEFVDRIKGASYEEIAKHGGGILNSAKILQQTEENELFENAKQRLAEVMVQGTGAIEIKSGYGLTVESELKILRVIRRLKELNWIPVKATFLGAHAIPLIYKSDREGYIRLIIDEMLPRIQNEGLADYIDVFCDKGFFTVAETDVLLEAGARFGLSAKIHANELDYSGGIQVGVKHKAISVDHLEYSGEEELQVLAGSETVATVLPSTAFFLGLPYAPARKMIDYELCVALASDYNPGTSPSGNMSFVLSLACIKMKMLPEEAINAATINGAAAINQSSTLGSIRPSNTANLIITKPAIVVAMLPYSYGQPWIEKVIVAGKFI